MQVEFSDEWSDECLTACWIKQASIFDDAGIRSSLALVLLFHCVLAFLLWYSPKPQVQSLKWIDVKLVSLQGYPEAAGPGSPAQGAEGPPAASSAPENREPPGAHPASEIDTKPPAKKISTPVPRPKKPARAASIQPDDHKEIKSDQPPNPAPAEAATNQSEGSSPAAGPVAGTAAGASNREGVAGKGASGGSGVIERSFGSPDGPSFLHKILPTYPALAKKLEKEGTVLLRVTIDEGGRPVLVEVLTKAGFGFDEEAVKAVQGSTFVPAKKEGKTLACKALLPIRFVLRSS
jgi:protein TonB